MRNTLFPIALLLTIATANSAEFKMRPGLWELTTTSDLLKLVPMIPPDQMQNLTVLAKQYGLDMPKINNGAAISRVCVTPEMANQKIPTFLGKNQYGCDIKDVTQTKQDYKVNLICESAALKGRGVSEGMFTNPESFTGRTEFNGVVQGNPIHEIAYTDGRWMNAHCETIKPAHM